MSHAKMKNCLRCKPFWVAILLGVLGSVLGFFAVFDQSFYGNNLFIFIDIFRFSVFGAGLFGLSISGYYLIKEFCIDNKGFDTLLGGITCTVFAIIFIMILIYYVPMAYDEAVLRSIDNLEQKRDFAINQMNCRSILEHDNYSTFYHGYYLRFGDTWNSEFTLDGEAIEQKINDCKGDQD